MWWNRRQNGPPTKEVTICARLKEGEMLQITFSDSHEPRQLHIEGWGEVRLKVTAHHDVSAELVQGAAIADLS